MDKLNDRKELTGESAVEVDPLNPIEQPEASGDIIGLSSAFGTDLTSVNMNNGMETTSNLKEGESPEKKLNETEPVQGDQLSSKEDSPSDDKISPETPESDQATSDEKINDINPDASQEGKEEMASVQDEHPQDSDEEEDMDQKDFGHYSRPELINEFQNLLNENDPSKIEKHVYAIQHAFYDLAEEEQRSAEKKFREEKGGKAAYIPQKDTLSNRFEALMNRFKSKKANYNADLEKQKDVNLQKKHEILEALRKFVDAEETNTSISALKKIQQDWKSIGPIPHQFTRSLWASYNALIDRFYDNRSIYFELKELDRKKNLEGKIEICEKAELLANGSNLKEAIKELNELHEEFKHIGPVPQDQQEVVWQRFKSASDQIYSRRKEYLHDLKKNLQENLEMKTKLMEEVEKFADFASDNIVDWNNKTREILDIQKKWESVGAIPKEQAKSVNKNFWSSFKSFFSNKNKFFKKLEGMREENLKRKEELIGKAAAIKDSDNWEETANQLKEIQQEWKNIGPVPEKFKNEIFIRFKAECDEFFDRKRQHGKEVESEYQVNLTKKEEICDVLESMINDKSFDVDKFQQLHETYESIGYVPRNAIKKIQKRFSSISEKFLDEANVSDDKKAEIRFSAEINKIRSHPDSDRKLQRKEIEIRKLINKLENDIAIWRNNLDFFRDSDTADKLRAEFNLKIDQATAQMNELKEELKMIFKS